MSANGRVLDVTAHTTLDFVGAAADGPGWTDEGVAVLDVSSAADDPEAITDAPWATDGVRLELELDPTACERVEPHADRIHLTREQARTLADALLTACRADGDDGGGRDAR